MARSLHVLVLTFLDYPSYEGGAIRLRHIARALVGRGHRVTVVAPQIDFARPLEETFEGARVRRVPMAYLKRFSGVPFLPRTLFNVHFVRALLSLHRRGLLGGPVDLIQIEEQFPLAAAAHAIKRRAGAPILLDDVVLFEPLVARKAQAHFGPFAGRVAGRLVRASEARAYALCDHFTVASEDAARYLAETGRRGDVFLPNGVDTEHFRPLDGNGRPRDGSRRVFFSASPRSYQNLRAVENLLDASERLAARLPFPLHVEIVCGPRSWIPRRLVERVEALAPVVALHDNLPDLAPRLAAADAAVVPYTPGDHITGGARLKGLEYMACARPLVATPEGVEGIRGLVDGVHYLRAEDLPAFERRLEAVLRDPEAYRPMGEAARRFTVEHYDWSRVTREYVGFLETRIGRQRAG